MPTPHELIEKLKERLILGEISEAMYQELMADLQARTQQAAAQAGGLDLSDSVVKGDLSNTSGSASVGNVIINVPGEGSPTGPPREGELLTCPLCGRRNELRSTFRCRQCGRDFLCLEHFVKHARMCEECAAKAAAAPPATGPAGEPSPAQSWTTGAPQVWTGFVAWLQAAWKARPSYLKAFVYQLAGLGLFHVSPQANRRLIYPMIPMLALADWFLAEMRIRPFSRNFGGELFALCLVLHLGALIDVMVSCWLTRRGAR